MLTLIENGEVYAPAPLGRKSFLLANGKILKIGETNRRAPGLIDPHEHLLGGSGEKGFATQTPPNGFTRHTLQEATN